MVYKRPGGTAYTFQARTRHGWHPLTAPTSSKPLAAKMEGMWEALARDYRAWDLLDPILEAPRKEKQRKLGVLFDLWIVTRQNVTEIRRRLQDVDVAALVPEYLAVHRKQAGPGWVYRVEHFLSYLFPEGTSRPASEVTVEWLTDRLYAYAGVSNTLRRVHSGWSGFFAYCTRIKGLFPANPMDSVPRPAPKRVPLKFYELDAVERIIGAQPSPERRLLFTLCYATGVEVSTVLRTTKADVWLGTREIRMPGTKTHTRDRVAIVADWAWAAVERYVKTLLPTARLFPDEWRVDGVSHWHLDTVRALKLPAVKLHAARHHWAITNLRAGVPVAVVQNQLGHSTPILTLTTYGAFIPTGADRRHWAQHTAKAERKRQGAK